jgi:uncharacterized protein YcfJ
MRCPTIATTVALALVVLLTGAARAAAQPATDFAGLALKVKPGTSIWVLDDRGRAHSGRVTELTPGSLTLETPHGTEQFAEGSVHTVRRRNHSIAAGAANGVAFGVALGLLVGQQFQGDAGRTVVTLGAIGGAVGAGVGARIPGRALYVRRTSVAATPVVTPHGAVLTLRW